jgi:hypothetical protein
MDNQDHVIKLQQERERRQNLDGKKDALAKRVYELVNRTLENNQRDLPDPAQLQNLRSLAAGTDSLEELKIYILYQMSRPGRAPISPQFGRPLVGIIEELAQLAQEERAVEQVRLLLGYLYRYARYARDNQQTSGGAPRQSSNRLGGNR